MDNKPEGYYDPKNDPEERRNEIKFQRPAPRAEVFPEVTDEQVDLREKVRAKHQANVEAIQRRGLHDRIVAKLRHWEVLEEGGYPLELADKADDVIAGLEVALEELEKTPPDNQAFAGNVEGAVGDLEAAIADGVVDPEVGQTLADLLAGIVRQVADDLIADAIAAGGDAGEITDAESSLAEGDDFLAELKFKDAVAKYKNAISRAESAAS